MVQAPPPPTLTVNCAAETIAPPLAAPNRTGEAGEVRLPVIAPSPERHGTALSAR